MNIKSLIQTGVFNFQYKFRKMTIISRMDLNEIKLSTKPSRKSSTSGVVCWKRFIKWVDNILQRLDIFLEVPECMKLTIKSLQLMINSLPLKILMKKLQI